MEISVVICTHNPRKEFLTRVLEALKGQTLGVEYWELLIVDNRSTTPVAGLIDLSWHPRARCVREETLGSAHARICGINESIAGYILFVDDDNCLNEDYLEIAKQAMDNNPMLGALGSGKILPEYEEEPTLEALDYMPMLAFRNEIRSHYSNEIGFNKAIPYTAGGIIRKHIALDYVQSFQEREFASMLGRTGSSMLLSGEDVDLALHACNKQYLVGVIPELKITHLIPKSRLTNDYLVKIAAGHAYSHYILGRMWGYIKDYPENPVLKRMRYWSKWLKAKGLAKLIFVAEHEAVEKARLDWNKTLVAK